MRATFFILLVLTSSAMASIEHFERKIRPLLAEQCYECHSVTAKKLKGGLLLDHISSILSGGDNGAAIVPGKPDESLLMTAVEYKDVDLEMPPKTRLSDAQIADLRTWIEQGAPWPDEPVPVAESANRDSFDFQSRRAEHWCWQPIQTHPGSIDSFIDARLADAKLTPGPQADKRTLIRRLSFDLIGLPPSPVEIEAFLADDSPDAYSTLVDRLLASPHFGEKWARHWLDLFRYAHSYGHEFDYPIPHATTYRDYLIRALNDDLPYDDFIREHIAGDLIPNARQDAVLGTAFWWFGEAVHAPTDVRLDEADRVDNQIDVMSKSFLGLTVSCARCHDHKFDAISTADYYGLAGFLQSSRREEVVRDPDGKIAAAVDQIRAEQDAQALEPAEFAKLLLAARAVQRGDYKAPTEEARDPVAQPDLVFEDFEGQDFSGWTVTGKAFGNKPSGPIKPQRMSGIQGKTIANSFHHGDGSTGRLRSKPFTISHNYINFLIAGGAHKDKTCINLLIEGIVVQSTTGKNSDALEPAGWDVRDLIDTEAQIEIVDEHTSGWGHVDVDYIIFSEAPAKAIKVPTEAKIDPRIIASAAKDRDVDASQLSQLLKTTIDSTHPLQPWDALSKVDDAEFANAYAGFKKPQGQPADLAGWTSTGFWDNGELHKGLYGVLRSPTFTLEEPQLHYYIRTEGEVKIRLVIDGYWMNQYSGLLFGGVDQKVNTKGKWQWVTQGGALRKYVGHKVWVEIQDYGDASVSLRAFHHGNGRVDPPNPDHLAVFADPAANIAEFATRYGEAWAGQPPPWAPASTVSVPRPQRSLGMTDGSPENERVFIRGNHRTLGPEVPRQLPLAVMPEQEAITDGSGRLILANRIANSANPLTTRVIVNRLWHHLFGRGIVPSVDDFGVMGQPPSHPKLLDNLAVDFADNGWSLKHTIRRIVHSQAYRRTSNHHPPGANDIDPNNTLLYRAPLRRLQAEAIRDAILTVSGRLDRKVEGGTVAPYLTPFMQGRGRKGSGPIDGAGRRSIYISILRNFLPDMLMTFDFPSPFNAMGRRSVSNVPAQALTMMNSPLVADQAKVWGDRISKLPGDHDAKINQMFIEALGRPPTESQLAAARAYITESNNWQDLAHTLYNMKAFLYLN